MGNKQHKSFWISVNSSRSSILSWFVLSFLFLCSFCANNMFHNATKCSLLIISPTKKIMRCWCGAAHSGLTKFQSYSAFMSQIKKLGCKTCSYKHVKNWIFCEKLDFWQKSPVFILLYSNRKCKMPLNIETPQTLRPRLTIMIEFSANFVELREKVEGQISAFSGLCKTYWCKWCHHAK